MCRMGRKNLIKFDLPGKIPYMSINRRPLAHPSGGIDLSGSLALAQISQAAYIRAETPAGRSELESLLITDSGFSIFHFIHASESEVVVCSDDAVTVVAFRGTTSLRDWSRNLNARPAQTPWGRIHAGFRNALEQVWDRVLDELQRQGAGERALWLTGHSLGGAMAVLASARMHWEQSAFRPVGVRTFGQPAVGWGGFRDRYASDANLAHHTCRFVNSIDPVPRLPATASHVGQIRRFTRRGGIRHSATGAGVDDDIELDEVEPPMMTQEEEARFQEMIEALAADHDDGADVDPGYAAAGVVGSVIGALPGISHHALSEYIRLLGAVAR